MLVSYVAGMATNSVDGVRAHLKPGSVFSLSVFDSREWEMTPYFPSCLNPCQLVISSVNDSGWLQVGSHLCHHHVRAVGRGCVRN
jgi:hypothetical protein